MDELNPLAKQLRHIFDRLKGKANNFLENKLAFHWTWVLGFWITSWTVLLLLAKEWWMVRFLGVGLLAIYITHWTQQIVLKILPTKFIQNTSDKAVFITGRKSYKNLSLYAKKINFSFEPTWNQIKEEACLPMNLLKHSYCFTRVKQKKLIIFAYYD